jgi:single-stranded DNA-specific DHH superfamily exonuclease
MLTEKQMEEIRQDLDNSERPLFFFHDDADGVCSFLQFYKHCNKGKGIIVKSTPKVDENHVNAVRNYEPDKIFILDLAMVTQDFVDSVKQKIIWIDHHDRADIGDNAIKGVKYYNPKQNSKDDNTCIAKISYDIFKEHLWLGAVGTIGDWQLPEDMITEINEKLPELFSKDIVTPEKALFDSKIGKIAKIINFSMKGNIKEVHKTFKVLTRIDSAYELLNQESEQAKFVMKRYKKFEESYDRLLKEARNKNKNDDPLLVFSYPGSEVSLSGELSNELLYLFPEKLIIIARHHDNKMKTSFRSAGKIKVKNILEKAIIGINGRFGGHEYACGGMIEDTDWDVFINNIREIMLEKDFS